MLEGLLQSKGGVHCIVGVATLIEKHVSATLSFEADIHWALLYCVYDLETNTSKWEDDIIPHNGLCEEETVHLQIALFQRDNDSGNERRISSYKVFFCSFDGWHRR